MSKFIKWRPGNFAKHLLLNLAAMALLGCVIVWLMLTWLDSWTDHGHVEIVPEVKGMTYSMASRQLAEAGFDCELTDSIYDNKTRPGTVVEQNPKSGTKVKEGRKVYLTITAFSPKAVTVPSLTDVSYRQARSILEGLGIVNISVREVPSEYQGLVMSVTCDGRPLSAGSRIPVTSHVVIEVGAGMPDMSDSIASADDDLMFMD